MPNPKLETYKNKATGDVYDYTDADAQGKLTAILNGTDIDNFSDVESALADKVDVESGKGLSTNDYDDTEKAKVAGAFPRSEQAVLGAKNLLLNKGLSKTENGLTFTVNADKSVSVYGTATANTFFFVNSYSLADFSDMNKEALILNGCPSGGSETTYRLDAITTTVATQKYDVGSGITIPANNFADGPVDVRIRIGNGTNMGTSENPKVFKPMLRLATDTESTYTLCAMSNRELMNRIVNKRVANSTDANTLLKEGVYLYNEGLISNLTSIHLPAELNGRIARIEVKEMANTESLIQILYTNNRTYFWNRAFHNNTWTNWFKFEGTEVTPS